MVDGGWWMVDGGWWGWGDRDALHEAGPCGCDAGVIRCAKALMEQEQAAVRMADMRSHAPSCAVDMRSRHAQS